MAQAVKSATSTLEVGWAYPGRWVISTVLGVGFFSSWAPLGAQGSSPTGHRPELTCEETSCHWVLSSSTADMLALSIHSSHAFEGPHSSHRITPNSYPSWIHCDCSSAWTTPGRCWSHCISPGDQSGQDLRREDGCTVQQKETQWLLFQGQEKWSRKKD